jgi:4-amino-4-deoxy-L-arabinose transferase-like glycosyltransferase
LDEPNSSLNQRWPRVLWAFALALAFVLSVRAALRGGYIGPDYPTHLSRLIEWPKVFDFSATSPPVYYLLGHALFFLIGPTNSFPIALSILQVAINLVALWYFFQYIQPRFGSALIHSGLCLFLTFLPVRIIHAVTIGTDSMTIPLFVLVLFLFDKFLRDETSTPCNAALLGLALGAAVWVKYSFMALIPALFVVFFFLGTTRRWKLQRFLAICVVSLALPSVLSIHSFWASSRAHGYNTEKHWLHKGAAPDMDYGDLFSVKANDIQLFRAPEYFKREILAAHRYSYLGLVHLGIFTDTMNLFQVLSVPQRFGSIMIPDQKVRRPWKTPVMVVSMSLGVLWTLCALMAMPWALLWTMRNLWRGELEREDSSIFLGTSFFLLIFLLIPFVYGGALFGYWTPRLILPALLSFYLAAFLFVDKKIARRSETIARAILLLVVIQCSIECVMLT